MEFLSRLSCNYKIAREDQVRFSVRFVAAIDLYHAMLKQKILPVEPLIQYEAGWAKTKVFVLLGLKMAAA